MWQARFTREQCEALEAFDGQSSDDDFAAPAPAAAAPPPARNPGDRFCNTCKTWRASFCFSRSKRSDTKCFLCVEKGGQQRKEQREEKREQKREKQQEQQRDREQQLQQSREQQEEQEQERKADKELAAARREYNDIGKFKAGIDQRKDLMAGEKVLYDVIIEKWYKEAEHNRPHKKYLPGAVSHCSAQAQGCSLLCC